tara:strand:- start:816 stop:1010 length:195 start_codon:yes stop_codon:yes gene_type:complete
MRAEKSNYRIYASLSKVKPISKPADILDLIKKNKVEEKREKILKVYTMSGFLFLIFLFVLFRYI